MMLFGLSADVSAEVREAMQAMFGASSPPPGLLAHITTATPEREIEFSPGMARLVALFDQPLPKAAPVAGNTIELACAECWVRWRGQRGSLCWSCGGPSAAAGSFDRAYNPQGEQRNPTSLAEFNVPRFEPCHPPCVCLSLDMEETRGAA